LFYALQATSKESSMQQQDAQNDSQIILEDVASGLYIIDPTL